MACPLRQIGETEAMRGFQEREEALLSEIFGQIGPPGETVSEAVNGPMMEVESLLRRHPFSCLMGITFAALSGCRLTKN